MGQRKVLGQCIVHTVDGPKVFTRQRIEAAWPAHVGYETGYPYWELDRESLLLKVRVTRARIDGDVDTPGHFREDTIAVFAPGYWTHVLYGPSTNMLEDYLAE